MSSIAEKEKSYSYNFCRYYEIQLIHLVSEIILLVSRAGVETATWTCQQIRRPYGKLRMDEVTNLQKIMLTTTQISERKVNY